MADLWLEHPTRAQFDLRYQSGLTEEEQRSLDQHEGSIFTLTSLPQIPLERLRSRHESQVTFGPEATDFTLTVACYSWTKTRFRGDSLERKIIKLIVPYTDRIYTHLEVDSYPTDVEAIQVNGLVPTPVQFSWTTRPARSSLEEGGWFAQSRAELFVRPILRSTLLLRDLRRQNIPILEIETQLILQSFEEMTLAELLAAQSISGGSRLKGLRAELTRRAQPL